MSGENWMPALARRLRASSVVIRGGGSGVIWTRDGLIVTNAHVARHPKEDVVLPDGRRLMATVIARDRRRDLAALRVHTEGLTPAIAGDSNALRVGEIVVAMGNPLGLTGALSSGIVHALGGDWIQADLRLAPGNSGGILADASGRLIGINTMIAMGLALAIPVEAVQKFLSAHIRAGSRAA